MVIFKICQVLTKIKKVFLAVYVAKKSCKKVLALIYDVHVSSLCLMLLCHVIIERRLIFEARHFVYGLNLAFWLLFRREPKLTFVRKPLKLFLMIPYLRCIFKHLSNQWKVIYPVSSIYNWSCYFYPVNPVNPVFILLIYPVSSIHIWRYIANPWVDLFATVARHFSNLKFNYNSIPK